MKNILKKILICGCGVIIFAPALVFAKSFDAQYAASYFTTSTFVMSGGGTGWRQTLGASWDNNIDYALNVTARVNSLATSTDFLRLELIYQDGGGGFHQINQDVTGQIELGVLKTYSADFGQITNLSSAYPVYYQLNYTGLNTANVQVVGSNSSSSYAFGQLCFNPSMTGGCPAGGSFDPIVLDARFVFGSSSLVNASNGIDFITPQAQQILADFQSWDIHYNLLTASSGIVQVQYSQSPTLATSTTDFSFLYATPSAHDLQFHKSQFLYTGTWYAQATMTDSQSGFILAQTPIIQFNILNQGNTPQQQLQNSFLGSTSTLVFSTSSPTFQLEICPSGGFFTGASVDAVICGVKNLVRTIFNDVIDGIKSLLNTAGNLLTHIFPVSVFVNLNNDFAQIQATSTPEIVFNSSSTFGGRRYELLTSSTMDTVTNKLHFDYRTILDKLLYLGAGALILAQTIALIKHLRQGSSTQHHV